MTNNLSRLLLPMLFAALASILPAQMSVTPGGGNVSLGSTIDVTNSNANHIGYAVVCVDGQIFSTTVVNPTRTHTFTVPELPQLVGTVFEIKTVELNGTVNTYTFKIKN